MAVVAFVLDAAGVCAWDDVCMLDGDVGLLDVEDDVWLWERVESGGRTRAWVLALPWVLDASGMLDCDEIGVSEVLNVLDEASLPDEPSPTRQAELLPATMVYSSAGAPDGRELQAQYREAQYAREEKRVNWSASLMYVKLMFWPADVS